MEHFRERRAERRPDCRAVQREPACLFGVSTGYLSGRCGSKLPNGVFDSPLPDGMTANGLLRDARMTTLEHGQALPAVRYDRKRGAAIGSCHGKHT